MNGLLLFAGIAAWGGVVALSIWMATIDEPVWGWFPIVVAVFAAWAIGEVITDRIWGSGSND
jgi:hypothetical protein